MFRATVLALVMATASAFVAPAAPAGRMSEIFSIAAPQGIFLKPHAQSRNAVPLEPSYPRLWDMPHCLATPQQKVSAGVVVVCLAPVALAQPLRNRAVLPPPAPRPAWQRPLP